MKKSESTATIESSEEVLVDGVKIYSEPQFVTFRSATKTFYCKDENGKIVVEFKGMKNLMNYVAKKTGKSPKYVRQYVYKYLNKKEPYFGYYWTDKK